MLTNRIIFFFVDDERAISSPNLLHNSAMSSMHRRYFRFNLTWLSCYEYIYCLSASSGLFEELATSNVATSSTAAALVCIWWHRGSLVWTWIVLLHFYLVVESDAHQRFVIFFCQFRRFLFNAFHFTDELWVCFIFLTLMFLTLSFLTLMFFNVGVYSR